VETFSLSSAVLGETRRINVYLPPAYAEDPAARFPVLYIPDGGLAEDFPHIADAVHAGISWGILRPLIVVGIENTERRRDLTGPTEVESDRKVAPRVGGSAAFRRFLREELMPDVERRYRTAGQTAVMGESVAGLFVVETFLLEPDLFDIYVAISPSLWWNGGRLVAESGETLGKGSWSGKTLYLTSADEEDIVAGVEKLVAALRENPPAGLTWYHHPMPDQFHDTIYRASSPKALRILFPAPRAEP
jgi:predicted alpha/beta superfamily hydrolase